MKIQNKINNIIYGSVMLAPLVAIVSTCAYSIFNKNAVNDYFTEKTFTTNTIESKDDIFNGNLYELDYTQRTGASYIPIQYVSFFAINNNNDFIYPSNVSFFTFRIAPAQIGITGIDTLGHTLFSYTYLNYSDQDSFGVYFVLEDFTGDNYEFIKESSITTFNVVSNEIVDNRNTFYYSLDKVKSSHIFNWADNTPYYSVFDSFTNFFGVDDDLLPFMLSYWLTCSLVMLGYEVITFMVNFARNLINKFEDKSGGF